jgi:hypothetical protein
MGRGSRVAEGLISGMPGFFINSLKRVRRSFNMNFKHMKLLFILSAFFALTFITFSSKASAQLTCTDIGGTPSGSNCTLSSVYDCAASPTDTNIDIGGNFTITGSGGIDCSGAVGSPGDPCSDGDDGANLNIVVGGNFTHNGLIDTRGGAGGAGAAGTGANGCNGGNGGNVDIDVTGNMTSDSNILAGGGAGGNGASNSSGPGGTGGSGGQGGNVIVDAGGFFIQNNTSSYRVNGGTGGAGGNGGAIGSGGIGGSGNLAGNINIRSCLTIIGGLQAADGGAGGNGGDPGIIGSGGNGGNGDSGGSIFTSSGNELVYESSASLLASGGAGGNGGSGGTGGSGDDGGTIDGDYCSDYFFDDQGATIIAAAGAAGSPGGSAGGPGNINIPSASALCCDQVNIPALNIWGMILFFIFAGLGAFYVMRKNKRMKKNI